MPRFRGSPDHHRHPRTEYFSALSHPTIHLRPPRSPSPHLVKAPRTRVPTRRPFATDTDCELSRGSERNVASRPLPATSGSTAARPGAKGRPQSRPPSCPSQPWNLGNHSAPALLLNQPNHPHQCHHETHPHKITSGPATVHIPSTGRPRIIIRLHSPLPRRKQCPPHARALPSQGTPHDSFVLANSPKPY